MFFNDYTLKLTVKEFLYNIASLIFILIFSHLIKQKTIKKISTSLLLIVFYYTLFIKIFTLTTFKSFIDNAALYTAFETNVDEMASFFSSYSSWYYFLLFISYILVLLLLFWKSKADLKFKHRYVLDIVILLCTAIVYRFYERSLTLLTVNTFIEYKIFTNDINKSISNSTSTYFTNVYNNEEEALYVIVIGESTTRNHMGIYNYYRDTNPNLKNLKNELFIFNDVISPHTHTILSLNKVLSLADYDNPENNKLGTVLQLANMAGFKTYWLSNQKPIGAYESLTSLYAKASSTQYYISNVDAGDIKYDEVILPKFKDIIDEKVAKKIVFVHLEGSHISYHKKYPEKYNYFKDQPKTKFSTPEAYKIINEYDNSIRYNDYVVSEIIDKVKSTNKNSYVLYFSDHGEEVYSEHEYFGHVETIGSNAMFEIPFILWVSDKYKLQSTINFNAALDRKYILEDFIYSFSDLSRIKFDQHLASKSIFNDDFKYKKRMVLKNVNYDDRIKTK